MSSAAGWDLVFVAMIGAYAWDENEWNATTMAPAGALSLSALYGYLSGNPPCERYWAEKERQKKVQDEMRSAVVRNIPEEQRRLRALDEEKRREAALRDIEPRDVRFTHGRMNIRSGPSQKHAVVSTLARGSQVEVGTVREEGGWARVYQDLKQIGFIYAESSLLNASPPAPVPAPARRSRVTRGGSQRGALSVCRRRVEAAAAARGARAALSAPYASPSTIVDYDGATRYTIYSEVVMAPGGTRSYTCTLDYVGNGRYRSVDFYLN